MKGLDQTAIAALMAKGKTAKGTYETCTAEFLTSDEPGIDVRETWPLLFAEKSATAMVQSFNNVRNKLNGNGEHLLVKRDGENVYLINLDKVEVQ